MLEKYKGDLLNSCQDLSFEERLEECDLTILLSSFPHIFPLLCGVDVSYETPPFSTVSCVLP